MISFLKRIDWFLFGPVLLISAAGLVTMNSFAARNIFFNHQLIWLCIATLVFFIAISIDWRFLKDTRIITVLYGISVFLLVLLFIVGKVAKGAESWFSFGFFSIQPVDLSELVIILVLAKYFSRRHIEIANVRHIIISGLYALIIFVLVFLQPDFGASLIIFFLWLAMVLFSGISKKHLAVVFLSAVVAFAVFWGFLLKPYQKDRVLNFIHPLTNIHSSGYNAYQSTIAVGSGQVLGKGIGQGSQSRLLYLPEYQNDFIFAAFAEEWGFVGVIMLFVLFAIVFGRMISVSSRASSNFDMLFGLGLAALFMIHATVNIGANMGLLPITGTTLPFMSYGGSHLVAEFLGLGILSSLSRHGRATHKERSGNEILGVHSGFSE